MFEDATSFPPCSIFPLIVAVEPPKAHLQVRRSRLQHDFAARFQPIIQTQRANPVGVLGV
jgi:hypothetical protein